MKTKHSAAPSNWKLQDPINRRRYEKDSAVFRLEIQILLAMEQRGWTYDDLAREVGTSKSNISRDLSGGRINSATVSRLVRIGEALDLRFLPVFVPEKSASKLAPKIQELVAS